MTDVSTDAFEATMRELRAAYLHRLPEQISKLRQTIPIAGSADEWNRVESIHRAAHSLIGSAATFSMHPLSEAARSLADLAWGALSDRGAAPPWAELERTISQVELAAPKDAPMRKALSPSATGTGRTVFILDDDPARAADLLLQLAHFGFCPVMFDSVEAVTVAIGANRPRAVIADASASDALGDLCRVADTPLILLSTGGDVMDRLRAVRAGGAAYFTRPVNVTSLIDALEVRFSDALPEPFRVLLVEDDESLATVYARALRRAGMVVSIVSDPLAIVGPLAELRPDVILMDMYLPVCTGGELAMVIRQEPAWIGVPILYLSSERDRARQLDALRCRGDDFLTKPIDPARLVSEVTARGQRMRTLQARLSHDGLTGLLNHAAIRGELERELVRARRDRTPLTVAMLDIDGFKAINDTFGHPAGDRVLKNLSAMLRRRLRRSDLMGRYGGDEVLVILPATPLDKATSAMDALRGAFAQVRHGADDVFAAFTAGLAMMGPLDDASSLIAEADRALYVGKRAGKNRCQAADSPSP